MGRSHPASLSKVRHRRQSPKSLAHFNLPPVQIIASFFATLVQIGIKQWLVTIPKICQPDNPNLLICPTTTVFYSASIIWCALVASVPLRSLIISSGD